MAKIRQGIRIDYFLPLFVVLIFAILILGAESALRIRYPELLIEIEASNEYPLFCSYHPQIGSWAKKNFTHTYGGMPVTINKNGLRDKELPYENTENRHRILVLGDSVAWGVGVNNGETFCDFMENALESTDVINMSMFGFGTGEELLALKYEGLRYKPNIVILFFYMGNDICDTFHPERWNSFPVNILYLENNELKIKHFKISPLRRIAIFLNEKSYIINFINKKIFKQRGNNQSNWVKKLNNDNMESILIPYTEYNNYSYLQTKELTDGQCFDKDEKHTCILLHPSEDYYYMVELTKKAILEMKKICSNNDVEFIVILSPAKVQCNPASCYFKASLNKELMRFLEANNIPAVDLLSLFVDAGYDSDRIFLDDHHFTALGHKEVAGLILERLPGLADGNIE